MLVKLNGYSSIHYQGEMEAIKRTTQNTYTTNKKKTQSKTNMNSLEIPSR